MKNKNITIILSLIFSLIIVLILNEIVFFNGLPKVNKEKLNRLIRSLRDNAIILKNNFQYFSVKDKVDYNQFFLEKPNNIEFDETYFLPTPTIFLSSTLIPTLNYYPTPTFIPTPTEIILKNNDKNEEIIISPTIIKPTSTKKIKPSPTPIKKDDISGIGVPVVNSPFSEPYYNPSLAYKCYNTDKFIEVYADGIDSSNCYSKVKAKIEQNLTSVSLLGKSIIIHKKAYPAFKAVADELMKNPVAKKYKINTIGAYIFRCNVNASSSNRFDLCSSGCVLSAHSFGIAVDINWDENCNGCSSYTMPIEIVEIFEKYGFRWGGRYQKIFGATIDPMHFEYMYDLCKGLK